MNASDVGADLLAYPEVAGLVEFGSVARGSSGGSSDLDLLVVIRSSAARPIIRARIDSLCRWSPQVSATALTREELVSALERSPSFGAHLRDEGRVRGGSEDRQRISDALRFVRLTDDALAFEVDELTQHLDRLSNERRLGGRYGTAAGRLFSICRGAAILNAMSHGMRMYDWRTVFDMLAGRDDELRHAASTAVSLRPYFEALDGRRSPPAPATRSLYIAGRDATRAIVRSVPDRISAS